VKVSNVTLHSPSDHPTLISAHTLDVEMSKARTCISQIFGWFYLNPSCWNIRYIVYITYMAIFYFADNGK